MDYFRKMEEFIISDELWPSFRNPDFIVELEKVASEVYSKSTIEGYLSSILIFQQIAEEMLWVLLKDCQAMIKISLMGQAEINFYDPKNVMFGRLVDELKNTLNFQQKSMFIQECNALNTIRISVVHGLSKKTELNQLGKLAMDAKGRFDKISSLFSEAHKYFCDYFEHERENIIAEHRADEME